jgi:hypothetical protein
MLTDRRLSCRQDFPLSQSSATLPLRLFEAHNCDFEYPRDLMEPFTRLLISSNISDSSEALLLFGRCSYIYVLYYYYQAQHINLLVLNDNVMDQPICCVVYGILTVQV